MYCNGRRSIGQIDGINIQRRMIMNYLRYMQRNFYLPFILIALVFMTTQSFADDERYIKINRSIELFGRVYQEIINNYVDEIDPEKFMRAGIDGMLNVLDPYTVYIDERGRDEVDLLTTGRYGGIGITVGVRNDAVTITSVTKGYVAEKEGLMIGDRIIAVDDIDVTTISINDLRSMIRGEPGSNISFRIAREGYDELLEFELVRESIRVRNVTYSGFIEEGIVYVKLERFSRGAGGETRQALRELQRNNPIEGVILDLRDNSGGLLDAAVEVANIFVERGALIVSTHGRTSDSIRRYVASQEPLLPDVPLIVLINENSASASEIVAGAIQDLDRGVLVGTRSFGKGLVQTVAHLRSNAQLKITTSRYYTPTGRSIQTADYLSKAPTGLFPVDTDSLHSEFKTDAGRLVYEGKGIDPDSTVMVPDRSRYVDQLQNRGMIFRFVTKLVHAEEYKENSPVVDDGLLDRFFGFIGENGFEYREISEQKIREIRTIAENENYSSQFFKDLAVIEAYISDEKQHAFDRHREEIKRELTYELASRYNGEWGRIETELRHDTQFTTAMNYIKNKPLYQHQLTAAE
jgi:carboxyl-terminal processing protease